MALTEDQVNFFDLGLFDKSFAEQFDKLVDGKPAWCAIKNTEIAKELCLPPVKRE